MCYDKSFPLFKILSAVYSAFYYYFLSAVGVFLLKTEESPGLSAVSQITLTFVRFLEILGNILTTF